MYLVMAGGGETATTIAANLLPEGHDVAIIEQDATRCEELAAEHDILVINGDCCNVRYLEQARVGRAEAFVAATHHDEVNFVSCQLARHHFEVPRVVARVQSPRNEQLFTKLGIEPVSASTTISRLIQNEIVGEPKQLYRFGDRDGATRLVQCAVRANTPADGTAVSQLDLPEDTAVVAILRGEETLVPDGGSLLHSGDAVVALTTSGSEDRLCGLLLGDRRHARG